MMKIPSRGQSQPDATTLLFYNIIIAVCNFEILHYFDEFLTFPAVILYITPKRAALENCPRIWKIVFNKNVMLYLYFAFSAAINPVPFPGISYLYFVTSDKCLNSPSSLFIKFYYKF
ncbi:hypothetical protein Avbf_08506 [Armadillidium vulgare]|nr:hypothetical protein Avbf_08506 [Armadillidium vulgare]